MTAPARAFEARGEVVRRRWGLLAGALVPMTAGLVLARLGAPGWGVLVQWFLGVGLVGAFFSSAFRRRDRGLLRAGPGELALDGKRIAARPGIAGAYLASAEPPVVRIECRRSPSVEATLESEEDARALLDALGFAASRSVVSFRVFHGGGARLLTTVLSVAVVWSTLGALTARTLLQRQGAALTTGVLVPILLLAIIALQVRFSGRMAVGGDGLLLRRLGERRFVSYGAVDEVSASDGFVAIVLTSSERIRLHVGARAGALAARIAEARDAYLDGVGGADALIGPAGRALDRWLGDLRASTKPRAYRETHLDRESLWRVLDDASAPPATRAGAALALSSTLDEPSRARLRVAAESCAEPRLRVALTRVAEGASDAELEEALAPLLEADA